MRGYPIERRHRQDSRVPRKEAPVGWQMLHKYQVKKDTGGTTQMTRVYDIYTDD